MNSQLFCQKLPAVIYLMQLLQSCLLDCHTVVYGVLRVNLSGIDNMFRNYCWQTIVNINLVDFSIKASCVGGRRRLPPHDSVNCDVKQNAAPPPKKSRVISRDVVLAGRDSSSAMGRVVVLVGVHRRSDRNTQYLLFKKSSCMGSRTDKKNLQIFFQ